MRTGVVIGRFQVAALHEGHIALLSAVAAQSTRLVVMVGVSPAPENANDPLPVFCRMDAIRTIFPQATVMPVYDQPSDETWSQRVDAQLSAFGDCVIYGGRDNSLDCYKGRWPTVSLDLKSAISGKQVREAIDLGWSFEFRTGMVYAAQKRFPTSYQAVDVAILKGGDGGYVLLGRKEDETRLRFPGGFVDPSDKRLEDAAAREFREECGSLELGPMRYLGSRRIADWRYRNSVDKVMTSMYTADYLFGSPEPGDDLYSVEWVSLSALPSVIHDVHVPLAKLLQEDLDGKRSPEPTTADR